MSNRVPIINCPIMKQADGSYLTFVVKDGVVVNKVPTPRSQIRKERTSLLWKPEVKGSTSFIQQTKAHISALED